MNTNNTTIAEPVPGFGMRFKWQTNEWMLLFDEQMEYIRDDVVRAIADDRFVIYLSCPISPRGGGDSSTNVAIAKHTAHRIAEQWGNRVFVLNPASYQMESKEGRGLLDRHARMLKAEGALPDSFDLPKFARASYPTGGDYMRMWTDVLVTDDSPFVDRKRTQGVPQRQDKNCGGLFDAYYFLSASDVRAFFERRGAHDVSSGVEDYFASAYEMDQEFRWRYDNLVSNGRDWEGVRDDFVRYYTLRCGAFSSKGARDEWNIWVKLNERRRVSVEYGLGEEIIGFWDGDHVDPASAMMITASGYEVK